MEINVTFAFPTGLHFGTIELIFQRFENNFVFQTNEQAAIWGALVL